MDFQKNICQIRWNDSSNVSLGQKSLSSKIENDLLSNMTRPKLSQDYVSLEIDNQLLPNKLILLDSLREDSNL